MTPRGVAVLVVLGATLLAASYPPFSLPVLSFLAIAPAVVLVEHARAAGDPGRAFRWGLWYGLAAQGLVLYWMIVALWHFTPLAALGYLATVSILALYTASLFWFTVRVRLVAPRVPLWVVFPVAWSAVEWAIGHQGDIRFPWLGLGTSLADAPVLVQWADIGGARGVTLWLAWCNVMLAEAALVLAAAGGSWGRGVVGRFGAVAATVALAWGYGAWRMRTVPVREIATVGLIQPNVGYDEKWERSLQDTIMGELLTLSGRLYGSGRPDLVIWPEAAIPYFLEMRPLWDTAIARFAREHRVPIVAGGLHVDTLPDGSLDYRRYYNAAFFYDSTGDRRRYQVYGKHYLVPIVERVPFVPPAWFDTLKFFGSFSRGRELSVYPTAFGDFGVLICYESAFEDLPRRYRRLGADFLVNITNDAWFGRTTAPYQHASHLVLRAIETRMGIARAANSGISEFVDPLGRSYAETDLETETIVAGRLRTSDVPTLYVRLGDWVGWLVVLTTLGLAGVLALEKWRRGR